MFKFRNTAAFSPQRLLWLTLALQVVIMLLTYHRFILHPQEYLFSNFWDGMRTYFAFQYYINAPWSQELLMFTGYNYPYGDYIIYTDNGPLIAFPLKVLGSIFPGFRQYAIPVYDYLLLSGMLLSTYVLFLILKRLLHNKWLIVCFSLILPWTNPQMLRYAAGHLNLTQSAVLLVAVYCLLRLYLGYYQQEKVRKWSILFIASLVIFCLLHMYYLVLVLSFTGYFFAFWFFVAYRKKEPVLPILRYGLLYLLVPFAVMMGFVRLFDRYLPLRNSEAQGYDNIEWKTSVSNLFTGFPHINIRFLFQANGLPSFEGYCYLGAFALFGWLVFLLLRYVNNREVFSFKPLQEELTGRFLLLLGGAALACFFISLGDYYYIFDGQYRFTNYLNIFFYFRKLTPLVTQFRCLGRFSWIFFWLVQLVLLFVLDRSLLLNRSYWLRGLVALLVVSAFVDLKDSSRFFKNEIKANTLSYPQHLQEVEDMARSFKTEEYQALIPVPYYHIGTEGDYSYTIDADEIISNTSMQLSLLTGLPLMGSKMARTPPVFAHALFSIFSPEGPSQELLSRLDNRPVLIIYNKSYYDGRNTFYDQLKREPAASAVKSGPQLPQRLQLVKIYEKNDWILYRWNPKK